LASFSNQELSPDELAEISAHVAVCPDCGHAVDDMISVKRLTDAPVVPVDETLVSWSNVVGSSRDAVLRWIRDFVSEQFWVPVSPAVAAIQGLAPAVGEDQPSVGHARPERVCLVDREGEIVEGVSVFVSSPLAIDGSGVLSGDFKLVGSSSVADGQLSLVLDLHGRGGLWIGPEPLAGSGDSSSACRVVFGAEGFDNCAMLIPVDEYCLVWERRASDLEDGSK